MQRLIRLAAALALLCAPAARADFADLYADSRDMPINKAPRTGHSRIVVIPVQIDGQPPLDLPALHKFFGTASPGSLTFAGFFQYATSDRFSPAVTVAPLVQYKACPAMLGPGCALDGASAASLSLATDFARDVFRRAHEDGRVDFSAFDANGFGGEPDGVIDGAIIVANVGGPSLALPIEYLNSGSNLAGGKTGAFVLDGVRIPYCAIGGRPAAVLRPFAETQGLADLRYAHPSSGDLYPAWGGLHLSTTGDFDDSDKAILPDAESRRALGWQDHHVVSGTEKITLRPAAQGGSALKLGMMTGKRHEYFMVEARGQEGALDHGVADGRGNPVYGLAVYHVDWSRGPKAQTGQWAARLLYCLDCDPFHPFVRNLESSGTFGLALAGPSGGPRSSTGGVFDDQVLFGDGQKIASVPGAPALSPAYRYVATNYYDGSASGISIDDIHVNADHSVTAVFTAPEVTDPCSDVTCPPTESCVESGTFAGTCAPAAPPPPSTGTTSQPPSAATTTNGCSSTGAPGPIAALLFAALGLARRRSR